MSAGADPSWSLRAASAEDADAVREVIIAAAIAAWGSFVGAERIRRVNEDGGHPADLVAADAEGVFGIVSWDATSGEITRLYVHPRGWDRGAGTALLERAIDALRSAGCRRAWLNTEERGERTVAFYERRGWRRDGEIRERDWHGARLREPRFILDL